MAPVKPGKIEGAEVLERHCIVLAWVQEIANSYWIEVSCAGLRGAITERMCIRYMDQVQEKQKQAVSEGEGKEKARTVQSLKR